MLLAEAYEVVIFGVEVANIVVETVGVGVTLGVAVGVSVGVGEGVLVGVGILDIKRPGLKYIVNGVGVGVGMVILGITNVGNVIGKACTLLVIRTRTKYNASKIL